MPHPFRWQPGDGLRHATTNSYGDRVTALCGASVSSDNSQTAWLWKTCPSCDVSAHELAGVPIVRR
ncbi:MULTISPECIES: zinc finger protein [Saccharopolyspora]|uniref:zinc finger protein n=1 Tax=Saccharopolyspora TaxID=1835 RepID=UPI0031E5DF9C